MENSRFKFRAWDTENNKMIINLKEMGVFALQSIYSIDEFLVIPTNEKYPLMQYTGLKDKNGVEIYESDIVRIGYPYTETNAEVIFNNGQFYPDSKCETIYFRSWASESEVIGNIYEHPELLKEEN